MKTQELTADRWLAALRHVEEEELAQDTEAITAAELSKIKKCTRSTASDYLRKLVKIGRAKVVKKRMRMANGVVQRVHAYVLTQPERGTARGV